MAAALILLSAGAKAQDYQVRGAAQDPCNLPPPRQNIFGMYVPPTPDPRRDEACQEERRQQWDAYHTQQAQQAQAEEDAKHEAANKRRQEYQEQTAAENSPDNHCREPETARLLMESWSELDTFQNLGLKAVDIAHLTTTAYDGGAMTMSCHGVFETTKGYAIIGTLSRRNNVAGDAIWQWTMDQSQDFSRYQRPPNMPKDEDDDARARAASSTAAPDAEPSSFDDGLSDRKKWEDWYGALAGDVKDGATWWASNRSLPHHGKCSDKSDASADWTKGCEDARQMLSAFDVRRKKDATYKKGWNSL